MSTVPHILMKGITKVFGKVVANNNINLEINSGEIHSLLGENGAGKSTLMNILSGIYIPDRGSIFVSGKEVKFSAPKDAINAKIGMIHQHFKLVEVMTSLENIMIGQKTNFFINKNSVIKNITDLSDMYGLEVDVNKRVYDMTVGEKQILEILKVMYRGAKILVLDEPTTVFTPQETKKLFKIINKMKEQGCAIIFISHKMDEVMELSDKITVLRKGETIATLDAKDTNPKKLAELMVGHPVDLSIKKVKFDSSENILEVKDLKVLDEEGIERVKKMCFTIGEGEILGMAGIVNSGQKELCEALIGMRPVKDGEINFEGENIVGKNTRELIKKGISMSFIPEDRLGMGLVSSMDMVDNLMLKKYHSQKGFFIDKKPAVIIADEIITKLEIKTPGMYYPIKNLSGGNIQKILLGRELAANPKLLIMAYPVRGLDINTCYTIYDLINQQKAKGVGVLFIGEDLDVLIQLCDRVMVICGGEITGILQSDKTTKEEIGLLMTGHKNKQKET
ncbi:ABC transporter ATP-binding protein [Clostridium sp.]|uniref:ABC transporter ATP-binding protein n=1 Tax=Clostridium sp. TaxID=1506 RepID=UPI001A5791B0|nr:ABC transporter ATP-binding protein [Clostridium sp.]MBK5234754.1 ABC transporter ATP-binding protein [Clostridium sp.]